MTTFQSVSGTIKTAKVLLTTTGATVIVAATVVTGAIMVEHVRLAEVAAATPTVILDIYDTAATAVLAKLRGTKAMAASTPEIEQGPFILEPGQSLRATASAANQVHVTAPYVQLPT